jgi:hypothetical protein
MALTEALLVHLTTEHQLSCFIVTGVSKMASQTVCNFADIKIGLQRQTQIDTVDLLCHAPALLDKVELTVELWQKDDLRIMPLAVLFEN